MKIGDMVRIRNGKERNLGIILEFELSMKRVKVLDDEGRIFHEVVHFLEPIQ